MRKLQLLLFAFLFSSQLAFAQSSGINFQGIARNASGEPLVNQKITLRFAVIQSTESGTVEYLETKEVTSNGQGMFSVVIGDGVFLTKTGNFTDINWKLSPKFLKVELDPQGGTNFALMGTSRLQAVPFAYYANGVDAENVQGVLPLAKGGTGVASLSALKGALQLDQVSNTSDANKPLSTATQTALATKVDKVDGKALSTNDYTTAEKSKLAAITGTNTGDQDLSGLATTTALATKANATDVTTALATKVDKVEGKALSTNDYTTAEKTKLAAITGTNTGDQDLSGLATTTALATKANATDVTAGLATKVDKVQGKELSTNDYTTAEKTKLAAITGTNTGDQDLSGLATTTALATKANATDVTAGLATKVDKVQGKELSTNDYTTAEKTKLAAITGTNTGDQDLSGLATTTALGTKANATDVTAGLATKVDKVPGKELSTNDYTTAEKTKLAAITGTNTGDQDLSGYATTAALATKASTTSVTAALELKENAGNKSILTDLGGTSTSDVFFPSQKAVKTYVDAEVGAVDKVKVGLGNVDNTADVLKPISTATQEALDTKLSTADFQDTLRSFAKLGEFNYFTEQNIFNSDRTVIGNLNFLKDTTELKTIIQNRTNYDFIINTSNVGSNQDEADPREYELKFTADGKLRFSDGSRIYPYLSDQEEELKNVFSIRSNTGGYIELKTTSEEEDYYWTFKDDGKITFPDRGTTMGVTNGPGFSIFELNSPNAISLFIRDPYLENSTFGGINILQRIDQPFAIELITPGAESNNLNVWIYDSEGRLTFPDGTTLGRNDQNEDFSVFEINSPTGITLQSSQTFEDETDVNAAIDIFPQGNQGTIFMMTRDLESDEEPNIWQFDSQGVLSFPGGTIMGQFVLNEEPQIFNINSYNGISLAGGNEQPNGDDIDNKSVNLLISSPEEDEQGKLQIITRRYESDIIENKWTYDSEGILTFPDGTTLGTLYSGSSTYFELISGDNDGFKITTTDDPANPKIWEFDLEGYLIFPGGDKIENDEDRFAINTENNRVEINISDSSDPSNPTSTYWKFLENGSLTFPDLTFASGNISNTDNFGFDTRATGDGFSIITADSKLWSFGINGNLVFPDGTYFGDVNDGAFGFDTQATANGFTIRTGDENNPAKIFNFDDAGVLNLPGSAKIGMGLTPGFYFPEALQITTPNAFILKTSTSGRNWVFEANGNTVFPADLGVVGLIAGTVNAGTISVTENGSFKIGNENLLDKFKSDIINLTGNSLTLFNNNPTTIFYLSAIPRPNSPFTMFLNGKRIKKELYTVNSTTVTFTKSQTETEVEVQFDYIKN